MRTISLVVFNIVVLAVLAKPVSLLAAEPEKLTALQMDAITAGIVVMGMNAFAFAAYPTYPATYTYTNTSTTVISGPRNIVEIGLGFGKAVACCGPNTYTNVQSMYYAEGDRVIANEININTTTPVFSYSHGFSTVIVINTPSFQPSH